jgi:hypothetical protein
MTDIALPQFRFQLPYKLTDALLITSGTPSQSSTSNAIKACTSWNKIDFLQLNDYAAIANPGVRMFLCSIPFLGLMPLLMLYGDDPGNTAFLTRQSLIMVFIVVIMILPYVYPVWILRNRIRDKKIAEMDQITLALRGDKETVKTIVIQGLGTPTTTAELLTHQMFLESRWDWPIASHVQKLVLFGLLPPLAWVLAAMIENAMY